MLFITWGSDSGGYLIIYWFIIWNQYEIKMRLLIKNIKNLPCLFMKRGVFSLLSSLVFLIFRFVWIRINLIGSITKDYSFSTDSAFDDFTESITLTTNDTHQWKEFQIPNIEYDFVGCFFLVKMTLNCFVSGFQFTGIRFLNNDKKKDVDISAVAHEPRTIPRIWIIIGWNKGPKNVSVFSPLI